MGHATTSSRGHRDYVIGVLLRLLSTVKATNTTVSASAATLRAAWGAGFHPCSVNPDNPTVRDSANAMSAATDDTPPAQRSHDGPPAATNTPKAQKTLACTPNAVPLLRV